MMIQRCHCVTHVGNERPVYYMLTKFIFHKCRNTMLREVRGFPNFTKQLPVKQFTLDAKFYSK